MALREADEANGLCYTLPLKRSPRPANAVNLDMQQGLPQLDW